MSEWQPIETAPKGETILLLFRWGIAASGKARYGNLGEPSQDTFDWRCDCCGRFSTPTHWMPLPESPK